MDSTDDIRVLSLCAGYGGIELGLERLGLRLRTVAYVEREGFATANLAAKIEAGELAKAPIHTDVKTFPYEIFRGLVDVMLAGYPCQPFSSAGKRKGEDDPRHLWPHIADGIVACRPSAVFFENVQGHVTLGLRDVLHDLGRMGYRTTWGLFSAAEVGAPHQRKRVYILGWLPDSNGRRLMQHIEPKLADATCERRSGCKQHKNRATECTTTRKGFGRWPARPGCKQHNWEEPRTVANTKGRGNR